MNHIRRKFILLICIVLLAGTILPGAGLAEAGWTYIYNSEIDGYEYYYVDENGNRVKLKITGEGHNGMCRVYMNGNERGILTVIYEGTVLMWISVLISIVTAIFIIWLYIRKDHHREQVYDPEQRNDTEDKGYLKRSAVAASGKEEHE